MSTHTTPVPRPLRRTRLVAPAAAVAAALALAACSSTTGGSGGSSSSSAPAAAAKDTVTTIPSLKGQATNVILDSSTVQALTGLGVKLGTIGSATLSNGTVSFPITSGYAEIHSDKGAKPGYVQGSIQHDGSGISLSAGGTTVTLTNFVVDPGYSKLYGTVNGTMANVPLLDLDGTNLKISMPTASTVELFGTVAKLTDTAASALNQAFKTSALKAGIPLGVVRLDADATGANTYDASDVAGQAIPHLTGEATNVTVDAGTLKALTGLGVSVETTGTAKLDNGVLSFPITGGMAVIHKDQSYKPGYIAGSIPHEGSGITFKAGGKELALSNFIVDPGNSILTGTVGTGANAKVGVPLLFLDGTNVKVSTEGSNVVLQGTVAKLTDTAAQALDTTFGTTAVKAGLPLGVVRLVATPQQG